MRLETAKPHDAKPDEPEVSPNVEMYLKTLVRLHDGENPVPTSAVAKELSVASPSASVMFKRLEADGLVTHEGRQGVVPTAHGARIGALTLRRQLLAERLLVDRLGVSWEIAATEACRLEHAISPLVENRLTAFLDAPTTCPHGHPIPHADGTLWRHSNTIELVDLEPSLEATVVAVPHDMPELLKFLAEIALRPGALVRVRQRDRIVGLLTLSVDGAERIVSLQLASAILMQRPNGPPIGAP
ncbi:MAG: metal-dependent transcriptional regulator [Candidatus Baltobacteraceae bacterium]